jgi:glycosyltransferase involved in cell wall biosynthesis
MRIAMLSAREAAHGPLPKLVPVLAEAMRRFGHDVEVLPWGRREEREPIVAKVFSRSRDVREARRRVNEAGISVVVVHTGHDWSSLIRDLVLVQALRQGRRTIVVHFHGSQTPTLLAPGSHLFKIFTSALLRYVDGILVLSTDEQLEWKRFRPGLVARVVRNPAPRLHSTPGVAPRTPPMILCVSRLLVGKGILDLARAFALVGAQPSPRLVFAGDGPDAGRLAALVRELDIESRVELTGHLGSADLARLYAEATIFALPTTLPEGFPTVILEAMAAGLPVVTTASRGMADHLVAERNALFVEMNNPPALAAAIERLLAEPKLRLGIGKANRAKLQDFNPDVVAAEYLAALSSIESARHRGDAKVDA